MDVKLVESLVISHIVNDQTYAIVIAQPNLHHQIGAIEIVEYFNHTFGLTLSTPGLVSLPIPGHVIKPMLIMLVLLHYDGDIHM